MNLNDVLNPAPDVVSRELDGETMLLDLASGSYFGLNEVGAIVWQTMEDGLPLAAAVDRIERDYAIERAEAEGDVIALAKQLAGQGLAHPASQS